MFRPNAEELKRLIDAGATRYGIFHIERERVNYYSRNVTWEVWPYIINFLNDENLEFAMGYHILEPYLYWFDKPRVWSYEILNNPAYKWVRFDDDSYLQSLMRSETPLA